MPVIKKKGNDNSMIVVKELKDCNNAPYFKKKNEEAAAFLKKNGIPKWFGKKNK